MNKSMIKLFTRSSLIGAVLLTSSVALTQSQQLRQQQEALNMIGDFADRFCKDIPLTGLKSKGEIAADAKVEVAGLLKRLTNLGVGAAAEYQQQRYDGLLQTDLIRALENDTKCRIQIWNDLKSRLLFGPPPSVTAGANVLARAKTAGWQLLAMEDFTNATPGWPSGKWQEALPTGKLSSGSVSQKGGVVRVNAELKDRARSFDAPYPASLNIKLGMDMRFVSSSTLNETIGIFFARKDGVELQYLLQRNGSYALTRQIDNSSNLNMLEWVRTSIDTSRWNRLEVEVVDQTITLLLNGSVSAQYRDVSYHGGTVGFTISGTDKEKSDIVVEFDNFTLYHKYQVIP